MKTIIVLPTGDWAAIDATNKAFVIEVTDAELGRMVQEGSVNAVLRDRTEDSPVGVCDDAGVMAGTLRAGTGLGTP